LIILGIKPLTMCLDIEKRYRFLISCYGLGTPFSRRGSVAGLVMGPIQRHSVLIRENVVAEAMRIYLREFSTQEQNLGRVINPEQQHNKGPCRPIG
jgi:hypothetical protein